MKNLTFAGFFALASLAGLALASNAGAGTIAITTLDGVINTGGGNLDNSGAWKNGKTVADNKSNYITGDNNGRSARSFFSFDLSLVGSGQTVAALTLQLRRFGSNSGNESTETLAFHDVSTDPVTLNTNGAPNSAVFADLGEGASYGTFDFAGVDPTDALDGDVFSIVLTATAVSDFNDALAAYDPGNLDTRYFSIGGDLISNDGDDGIFGGSDLANGLGVPRPTLVVTTRETEASLFAAAVAAPEPGTLAALGFGLFGLSLLQRRRAKSQR